MVQTSGFSSFNLKYINQDVLKNCFSQVRDNGRRNVNPSPFQFSDSFNTLITINLTSSHYTSLNCEESNEGTLLALLKICCANEITKESNTEQNDNDIESTEATIPDVIIKNIFVDAQKIVLIIEKEKSVMECKECFKIQNNYVLENVQRALDLDQNYSFLSFVTRHK